MVKRPIYIIIGIIIFIVTLACFQITYFIFKHYNITQEKYFIIHKGTNIKNISSILNILGISTSNEFLLKILLFIFKQTGFQYTIKTGEYKIFGYTSLWEILQKITSGNVVMHNFTVIEGTTNFQIIKKLNNESFLINEIDEINILSEGLDSSCILDTTEQCYLFPETYSFTYGIQKLSLLKIMIKKGKENIDFFWKNNKNSALKSKNDLLVLASIIEKETQTVEEMPRISGVFTNRLLKNIKLQADPTVIYAITKGKYTLNRLLNKNDLKIQDEYNTYYVYGLPPKAICNPGINALKAAANPIKTTELYFVSNGNGTHNFANNINEHIKNIKNK